MLDSRFYLRRSTPLSELDLASVGRGWRTFQRTVEETIAQLPKPLQGARYRFSDPVLAPGGRSLVLSLQGARGLAAAKIFEDAFPDAVLAGLSLSTRLDLELGHGFGADDPTWRAFFSEVERVAVARAPRLWPESELDSLELRFVLANNRPTLTPATLDDGWVECPYCRFRFKLRDVNAFRAGRHLRCGQALVESRT